ncbi:Gfo/Idh/MocA family oxidoreductase [Actinomycetes bacterium KLBMP 9759]
MTPLKVVLVGAGSMGRAWRDTIEAAADVELAAIADIRSEAARSAADDLGRHVPTGTDAVALAEATGATAIVNVTVPEAHHEIATAALFAGLHVLGEKPVADTLAKALSLAAAAEVTGKLHMVSQSRRWNPQLAELRGMIAELGVVGTLTTEFFRAPRFGGFREEMADPLLVDMAIHAFDSARFLLGAEPVSVYCEAYNPPWSWFAGSAAASAVFTMEGGTRYSYTGSWCSPGTQTSWNGVWRVSCEKGSASWDGDAEPVLTADLPAAQRSRSPYLGIAGALEVFAETLRRGTWSKGQSGEVHENVLSLAMVEAAVVSAGRGERVLIDDVLAAAHAAAVEAERRPDVRAALEAWPSPRAALTAP